MRPHYSPLPDLPQQLQQPTDEPKVLGGGNMDPTNPLAGLENPEAEAKATEMGK